MKYLLVYVTNPEMSSLDMVDGTGVMDKTQVLNTCTFYCSHENKNGYQFKLNELNSWDQSQTDCTSDYNT